MQLRQEKLDLRKEKLKQGRQVLDGIVRKYKEENIQQKSQNKQVVESKPEEQAIAILKLIGKREVTPEFNKELTDSLSQAEKDSGKKLNKRPNLNFSEMGIPIGSELLYKDGCTIITVASDKKVLFNENEVSLTAVTRELMGLDYSVQPSPHWTYQGKLLRDIYNDTYSEE